jgi:hypothetical protein
MAPTVLMMNQSITKAHKSVNDEINSSSESKRNAIYMGKTYITHSNTSSSSSLLMQHNQDRKEIPIIHYRKLVGNKNYPRQLVLQDGGLTNFRGIR